MFVTSGHVVHFCFRPLVDDNLHYVEGERCIISTSILAFCAGSYGIVRDDFLRVRMEGQLGNQQLFLHAQLVSERGEAVPDLSVLADRGDRHQLFLCVV